eukprot:1721666-Rhodomonas_salina.1
MGRAEWRHHFAVPRCSGRACGGRRSFDRCGMRRQSGDCGEWRAGGGVEEGGPICVFGLCCTIVWLLHSRGVGGV